MVKFSAAHLADDSLQALDDGLVAFLLLRGQIPAGGAGRFAGPWLLVLATLFLLTNRVRRKQACVFCSVLDGLLDVFLLLVEFLLLLIRKPS